MLELNGIKKDYVVAGEKVHALKGVTLKFRKSEFVSILGPSGCGKTTLLNIIGGLDKYTSGDLIIEGVSTKKYGDRDWDTYRNHSIGFIFQSYHLIPHQTILQNVELALMISGVSKQERRQRAIDALDKVGLKDKIHNRPNQLSGGQAQRVAIARALINDPEIVLADEPTGALDSVTSVQIMELLKEISKDRLIIMVTHNPELAEQYSTRIVRLLDGEVTSDSRPYLGEEAPQAETAEKVENSAETEAAATGDPENNDGGKTNKGSKKKTSMSIGMAMSLSMKNLMSKSKRTAMVSVAGSIGIIGVSLVLAISSGVQGYIRSMEDDMLSGFPVSVTQNAYDFTSLMELSGSNMPSVDLGELAKGNKVYVNSLLDTLGTFSTGFEKTNNITEAYVSYVSDIAQEDINLVQYGYSFNIVNNIYTDFTVSNNLSEHLKEQNEDAYNGGTMSVAAIRQMYAAVLTHVPEYATWGSMISSVATFKEVPNNYDYVMSQYDVVAVEKDGEAVTTGYTEEELREYFQSKNSLIMVLNNYKIDDLTLAQYGYFTEDEFLDYAYKGIDSEKDVTLVGSDGFPYSKFVGNTSKKFTYYTNDSVYNKAVYNTKPQYSDDAIRQMMSLAGGNAQLAEAIINARNTSDEALRNMLTQMFLQTSPDGSVDQEKVEEYFQMFRLPSPDETTEGYVANAYSTAYTVKEKGEELDLPAFADKKSYADRVDLGVKMILQKKDSVSYGCLDSGFYYTNALTEYILEKEAESEIVKYIDEKGELDSVPMYVDYYYVKAEEEGGKEYYILDTVGAAIETGGTAMDEMIGSITGSKSSGITAAMLGGSDLPSSLRIYPVDFDTKKAVTDYLDKWNKMCENGETYVYTDEDGVEHSVQLEVKNKITYTDNVGMIIGMVNTMIQMITIALVAFTALSLVVSTVMIGIITYVSVVERVKEIGILRAVGARKKDIKRLFNSETFIIGLVAGLFGILITYLLSLIINIIVMSVAGFWGIAALPWWQAVIMVAISVGLTLISGLIPASAAAKKDPVVALRTE